MSKLKLFFAASVLILGGLLAVTIVRPLVAPEQYSQVTAESLLATGEGWVLQFSVLNHEGQDATYSVSVTNDGRLSGDTFVVKDGGSYTYIYNISHQSAGGRLNVSVYKEGECAPFEQSIYYLK